MSLHLLRQYSSDSLAYFFCRFHLMRQQHLIPPQFHLFLAQPLCQTHFCHSEIDIHAGSVGGSV